MEQPTLNELRLAMIIFGAEMKADGDEKGFREGVEMVASIEYAARYLNATRRHRMRSKDFKGRMKNQALLDHFALMDEKIEDDATGTLKILAGMESAERKPGDAPSNG